MWHREVPLRLTDILTVKNETKIRKTFFHTDEHGKIENPHHTHLNSAESSKNGQLRLPKIGKLARTSLYLQGLSMLIPGNWGAMVDRRKQMSSNRVVKIK